MAKYRVIILDRPAWYQPIIEREALSEFEAEVMVGWDRLGASRDLGSMIADRRLSAEQLSLFGNSYVPAAQHTDDLIVRMAYDADAIVVTRVNVTGALLDRLPWVRVIGRPGAGFNVIDVQAATARGVAVFHAPGVNAREVADHTMMLVMACARKAPLLHSAMRGGVYDASLIWPVQAVYEMTLGLIGFGSIGREVAKRARSFGFRVIATSRSTDQKTADPFDVTMASLNDLLHEADIVSLHVPLTAKTLHMLGKAEFALMKRSAWIVNTARGQVIDQDALVSALRSGQIAGAGLDVFDPEPLPSNSPLLTLDNVLLTPHVAGASISTAIETKRRTMRNVGRALAGEWQTTRDLLNPQVIEYPRLVPPRL